LGDNTAPVSAAAPQGRLTRSRLLFYSMPTLANTIQLMPVTVYIAGFYSGDLGLPLALVGLAVSATRLSDIFTDILLGLFSDRIRTRIGRRKPLIAAAIPLAVLGVWMLFVPPEGAGLGYLFFWIIFFNLATSLFEVPYSAWGAELSRDYDERSRVTGWRSATIVLGNLLALSIPFILQQTGHGGARNALLGIAVVYAVLLPVLCLPLLFAMKERPPLDAPTKGLSWGASVAVIWNNRAFRILALGLLLFFGGKAISAALNLIVIRAVIGAGELFPIMLVLENLFQLAAIPLWLWMSRRYGKHVTMMVAALWSGLFSLPLFFLGEGDGWLFVAIIAVRAIALSAFTALIPSMTADAVDVDTLEAGRERTGVFFGALNFSIKGAAAIGILLGTMLPALAGFQPSDATHAPEALLALRLVYAVLGPALVVLSAWAFFSFPIDRKRQIELRQAIDARVRTGTAP
jgi:Na+/melibiose symporter-like transporter